MKTLWDFNKTVNIDIEKKLGNVYTHPYISSGITKNCLYYLKNSSKKIKILDPSVGSGSFYYSTSKEVSNLGNTYEYDVYDIDKNAIELIKEGSKDDKNISIFHEDFLLSETTKKYDLIITNPPYVAHKDISPTDITKEQYITKIKDTIDFNELQIDRESLDLKTDLYMYFYLKCLSRLEDGGKLVFLCADTWLDTEFGNPLKKIITQDNSKYHLETVINSHYYPFFAEYTNAIVTVISKGRKKNNLEVFQIKDLEFILKNENKTLINNSELKNIFNNKEIKNVKNSFIIIPEHSKKYRNFLQKNKDVLVNLEDIVEVKSGGENFNALFKEDKIYTEKETDMLPLFFQKQARVNKPAIYRSNILVSDLKFFVKKDDIKSSNIIKDTCYLTGSIDRFPIVFGYSSNGEDTVKTNKYSEIGGNLDNRLKVILLNNIITIQSMEVDCKNSNKRSSKKNMNGVIKEPRKGITLKLKVPNLNLLTDIQKESLISVYSKYENTNIFDFDTALENEYYFDVQKKIFEYLGIDNFEETLDNVKEMYYIRQRHLVKLGLPLID